MRSRNIVTNHPRAMKTILRGLRASARLAQVKGKMIYEHHGKIATTNDCRAFLMEYQPDTIDRLGVSLVRDAILRVENETGSGGRIVASITYALVKECLKLDRNDALRLCEDVCNALKTVVSVECSETLLRQIAENSTQNDTDIVENIISAVHEIGESGTITLGTHDGVDIRRSTKPGMFISESCVTQRFYDKCTMVGDHRVIEGALVVVVDGYVTRWEEIAPILEQASAFPQHELLLFVEGIAGPALSGLETNHIGGVVKSAIIAYGGTYRGRDEWFSSLAALADTPILGNRTGRPLVEGFVAEDFGSLRCVRISRSGKGTDLVPYDEPRFIESIDSYCAGLRTRMETCTSDGERDRLREILAGMDGGYCRIDVGDVTESAATARRNLAERCVTLVRSALETGVILDPKGVLESLNPGFGRGLCSEPIPTAAFRGAVGAALSLTRTLISLGACISL